MADVENSEFMGKRVMFRGFGWESQGTVFRHWYPKTNPDRVYVSIHECDSNSTFVRYESEVYRLNHIPGTPCEVEPNGFCKTHNAWVKGYGPF